MPEFSADNFPVRITGKQTFEMFGESGCLSSLYTPWYEVIDRDEPDENGAWALRVYEFDVDEDQPIKDTVYTVTHWSIIEAMLTIAADTQIRMEFRAKVIALLVDPDRWDTQFDIGDEDVILQYATWGEERYG